MNAARPVQGRMEEGLPHKGKWDGGGGKVVRRDYSLKFWWEEI